MHVSVFCSEERHFFSLSLLVPSYVSYDKIKNKNKKRWERKKKKKMGGGGGGGGLSKKNTVEHKTNKTASKKT